MQNGSRNQFAAVAIAILLVGSPQAFAQDAPGPANNGSWDFAVFPANIQSAGPAVAVVADSAADWSVSGTQGEKNWFHGYFHGGTNAAVNDFHLYFGVRQLRQRVGECFRRTALVGLDEDAQRALLTSGCRRHEVFERDGALARPPALRLTIEPLTPLLWRFLVEQRTAEVPYNLRVFYRWLRIRMREAEKAVTLGFAEAFATAREFIAEPKT